MSDDPPEVRKALGETTAHLGMCALSTAEATVCFTLAGLAFMAGLITATFAVYHGLAAWHDRPKPKE